jgi:hypothetical protein
MDPIALGPEHLCALAFSRQAHAALEEICIRAQPKISRVLDDPETHNARYGEGYWASWPRMPASAVDEGDGAWLEWHILPQDSSGAIEIRAGLSIERHAAFDVELESRLTDVITIGDDERVVFRRWRGPKERLMRVGRPQDVLIGADLDAQADSLACWVTTTLQAVRTVAGLS